MFASWKAYDINIFLLRNYPNIYFFNYDISIKIRFINIFYKLCKTQDGGTYSMSMAIRRTSRMIKKLIGHQLKL
jgi:hypothetical protein